MAKEVRSAIQLRWEKRVHRQTAYYDWRLDVGGGLTAMVDRIADRTYGDVWTYALTHTEDAGHGEVNVGPIGIAADDARRGYVVLGEETELTETQALSKAGSFLLHDLWRLAVAWSNT